VIRSGFRSCASRRELSSFVRESAGIVSGRELVAYVNVRRELREALRLEDLLRRALGLQGSSV
jgi:hypothetical protein